MTLFRTRSEAASPVFLWLCAWRSAYFLHPMFSIPHGVLVLQRMARLKSASSIFVLVKSALLKSAFIVRNPDRSAPDRFAPRNDASHTLAWVRFAPCKFASAKSADHKLALDRFASLRFAPFRFAFSMRRPLKSAPLKSQSGHLFSALNRFMCISSNALPCIENTSNRIGRRRFTGSRTGSHHYHGRLSWCPTHRHLIRIQFNLVTKTCKNIGRI